MSDLEVARYGLRTFTVHFTQKRLGSMAVSGDHWKGGVCRAQCLIDDPRLCGYFTSEAPEGHKSPHEKCTCGIYASHSYQDLYGQYMYNTHYLHYLLVVIAAEGETLVGSRGFRTEYARMVGFYTPHETVAEVVTDWAPGIVSYPTTHSLVTTYGLSQSSVHLTNKEFGRNAVEYWTE